MQSIKKAGNEEQQSINTQSITKYIRNIYIAYYLFWNSLQNRFASRIFAHQNTLNSQRKYKIGAVFCLILMKWETHFLIQV